MDCSICMESFNQAGHLPKVMPCGHTVCLGCLQRLGDKKCPSCRQEFQVAPASLPNNFNVLQLLQDRPDRTDKTPGWCSRCCALATPRCWVQHDVLGVRAALEHLLEGALPQAAGELERLKNQLQDKEAAHAVALLSGKSWDLTLRCGSHVLSGKLQDTKDASTKALLILAAAKGELKAHTNNIYTRSLDVVKDLSPSVRAEDRAVNVEMIRGVQRLLNVSTNAISFEALKIAEPTLDQLSLCEASLHILRVVLAMPRLKRLRVSACRGNDLHGEVASVAADSLSEGLTDVPARLQWLDLVSCPFGLMPALLPAHRLTLEVLQLDEGKHTQHMSCHQLFALLKRCDLRALRRLVLVDVLADLSANHRVHMSRDKDECSRRRSTLLGALPAGAAVLCWMCDGDDAKRYKEDF
ncbi:uncharacterized protein LOC113206649 [Frankliniella occidentalis]|uniref:Uncharacterized protein LOC113206649 n=1 Tax=Frankliniella occidentalis TaxID=133901 RepID=A0A6J1SD39_FRAOC|nr:uncharacterized protein LOC113206649 [Frankliniella occidentalis]XP_026278603.2 uncharacterized protein LOC113206649 [Frankliniella occidentalis]XP_052129125.1 uncharacterized protein LOC113206649 [Frankliniella occidentalis]